MIQLISPSTANYTVATFHYANTKRTEQSLDIYEPIPTRRKKDVPTIVLVMGSGWLGHAPWIYTGTNWWNSSGAATLADLGYRTISVRHSGGFFRIATFRSVLRSPTWLFFILGILTAVLKMAMDSDQLWEVGTFVLSLLLLWSFLQWQAIGAADLDDMVQDVDRALNYVKQNLNESSIVLAGYSSGGHVVATWLSRQEKENLSSTWIRGILYISGVLSLDSSLMNFVTLTVFGKWAQEVPGPFTANSSAKRLPLPPTKLRHLILGCRHETFGVPVLDATFCYEKYSDWIPAPSRCVLVDANHWSILSSHALSEALAENLPWLFDGTALDDDRPSHPPTRKTRVESIASLSSSSGEGSTTTER